MIRYRLAGDEELELDPAPHWAFPKALGEINPDSGPVMVTIEYLIDPARAAEFASAMQAQRQIRLRDGAIFWVLFFDTARLGRFVEYFLVESWMEHLRQHERTMVADLEVEERARSFHIGTSPPVVSHLLSAQSVDQSNADFFAQTTQNFARH
jgi:hypothetical protein